MSASSGKTCRILVPTDFSECSRAALDRALELAGVFRGKVGLMHVVDTSGLLVTGIESYVDVATTSARIREAANAELQRVAAAADPERRTIESIEVYDGRPVQAIIDAARERAIDLIVIGTHGRRGLPRLFMGSVAERVIRLAPCDVLVVHARAADKVGPEPRADGDDGIGARVPRKDMDEVC